MSEPRDAREQVPRSCATHGCDDPACAVCSIAKRFRDQIAMQLNNESRKPRASSAKTHRKPKG